MVVGLLAIYHAYWIFAAIVIGFALAVNLLLSWFIDWFQYTAGRSLQELPLDKYLAVLLRSCLLIRLFSQLLRVAIWLMQDAVRLEAFQVYRCILCGGAVKEMVKGDPECIYNLCAIGGWKYKDNLTGWLDLLAQALIYISFDVVPLLVGGLEFSSSRDISSAASQFSIWACGTAVCHVLIFHLAETANDIVAKCYTAYDIIKRRRPRRHIALGTPQNAVPALSPYAAPAGEEWPTLGSSAPSEHSDTPTTLFGAATTPRSDSQTLASNRSRSMISSFSSDEGPDENVQQADADAPWNACVLLCSCVQTLGELLIAITVCALYVYGIWSFCQKHDYSFVVWASLVVLAVACYRFRRLPQRCSRKVAKHAPKQPPQRWSSRWRSFWRYAEKAERWGDLQCGLAEEHAAPQYELHAIISVLQGFVFWYISWWRGVALMSVILALQVLRRLTLGLVRPFGWLLGLLEAVGIIVTAIVLNGVCFDSWYALGAFLLGFCVQFTLNRQHRKTWRVLLWVTFLLQLTFVIIVSVSMRAVIQTRGSYSNFCPPGVPCQYFYLEDVKDHHHSEFCDMHYPLGRRTDENNTSSLTDELENKRKHENASLRLPDFAMFSALAYESNNSFDTSLSRWFPGWTLDYARRVEHLDPTENLHQDWTTFFELSDPLNETTVFAIRGTHLPLEILQDFNIWAPIAIPQLASFLGPDLTSVSARAVLVLSTTIYGEWMQKKYYAKLLERVKHTVSSNPHKRFYITGHSLGGGLAKLVSMETDLPSITFSSPGVDATRMLLSSNTTMEKKASALLHKKSYTVVPDNDIVPQVDSQLGTIMRIGCNRSPLDCHGIGGTLCELLFTCGASERWKKESVPVNCQLCPHHRHLFPACNRRPGEPTVTTGLHGMRSPAIQV